MPRHQSQRGFTLIELSVVIAIIAIIATTVIPNLIEARKGENEAAAIGTLRTLSTAQRLYRESDADKNGIPDYASSLAALGTANLIDNALATGEVQGYVIEMTTSDDRMSWQAVACPAALNRSGGRCFAIGQTAGGTGAAGFSDGRSSVDAGTPLVAFCQAGQKFDPPSGACRSDETSVAALGFSAIESINNLSSGLALGQALVFLAPGSDTIVQTTLRMLDKDGDGRLTFAEALNADLLDVARSLLGQRRDGGRSAGNDRELETILRRYQDGMRRDLALGIANENRLPAIEISNIHGDPSAFLSQAESCPALHERCP